MCVTLDILWVVDVLDDSVASRSSTNLLPLFRAAELVSENTSVLSTDVSSGVGARVMPARWERRSKRSIQARSMDGRKRRMKISIPTSYMCQLYVQYPRGRKPTEARMRAVTTVGSSTVKSLTYFRHSFLSPFDKT